MDEQALRPVGVVHRLVEDEADHRDEFGCAENLGDVMLHEAGLVEIVAADNEKRSNDDFVVAGSEARA